MVLMSKKYICFRWMGLSLAGYFSHSFGKKKKTPFFWCSVFNTSDTGQRWHKSVTQHLKEILKLYGIWLYARALWSFMMTRMCEIELIQHGSKIGDLFFLLNLVSYQLYLPSFPVFWGLLALVLETKRDFVR